MREEKLWDLHQLLEHYPCFTVWGIRHLIRNRRIPMVRIGTRRIFFDPKDIADCVSKQKINPEIGGKSK